MRDRGSSEPESWVDRHGDALFAYALARVGDPQTAEDLVQEAFLGGLKARAEFAGQSSERTWLVAILKRRIVDHFRRVAREAPEAVDGDPDPRDELFTRSGLWRMRPVDWGADPARAMEQGELSAVLQRCLAALPRRMAAALVLREMEGIPSEEVCKILEVSPTNLWTLLHRARSRLRMCLERNWFGRGH